MRRVISAAAMVAALAVALSGCSLWQDGENVAGQVLEGIAARQVLTSSSSLISSRVEWIFPSPPQVTV